jgi:hypothetical protein
LGLRSARPAEPGSKKRYAGNSQACADYGTCEIQYGTKSYQAPQRIGLPGTKEAHSVPNEQLPGFEADNSGDRLARPENHDKLAKGGWAKRARCQSKIDKAQNCPHNLSGEQPTSIA